MAIKKCSQKKRACSLSVHRNQSPRSRLMDMAPNAQKSVRASASHGTGTRSPPRFIAPELCRLVEKAPSGPERVHETKFDGYRMTARIDRGRVSLLTRPGLDWSGKRPQTAAAHSKLPVQNAYIDGELCGVATNGISSFALIQAASDSGTGALVYFAFVCVRRSQRETCGGKYRYCDGEARTIMGSHA